MSSLPLRLACLELAEDVLEAELARTGTNPATSARALSLATAIQEAIEDWQIAQAIEAGEGAP